MLRCNDLLPERQVGILHGDASPIYHDKPVGFLAEGISQRALLRVGRFALSSTDPRAQTPFGQHALEPPHELLTGVIEVLKDGPEKLEDFVVACEQS